jgi:predicted DNA-binding transcriptional regulator AlpA
MPVERDGEIYYTAAEVARHLQISRVTFYKSVKERIQPYQLGFLKRVHYRKSEIDALQQSVRPIKPEE